MTLAYTSSGVEDVTVIDEAKLDDLARWLCQDKDYHYYIEKSRTRVLADNEFDRQLRKNGGYCNVCKDFAGEILSRFDLSTKVSA